jgi:hypothetical protein
MDRYLVDDLEIIFDIQGRDDWGKFSFPVCYGLLDNCHDIVYSENCHDIVDSQL